MKKLIISCLSLLVATATQAQTPVYLDESKPLEQRVEDALRRMTLDEKIAVIHAQSKFSSPGVKRLGIPDLWTDDGPHGVRPDVLWDEWEQAGQTNDSCVAFPALTCLAATWNPQLARHYGESLGEEALYRGKSVMLSGSTGLLGSFLIDVLMEKNRAEGLHCTVCALGRNPEKAADRFSRYAGDPHLRFIPYDVKLPLLRDDLGNIEYVLHLASNTHPVQYAADPIGTITTNIIGLKNMLDFAAAHHAVRFAFASSNEIYGENRGDAEFFDENYCGFLNPNTLRAGYPESKRCGEALCQAYRAQEGLDVVIPRFTRSYGPTMLLSDTKAVSQFIKKGVSGEDIVLKSAGTQFFSYQYMADSVSGLLTILLKGADGEAYNIAEEHSDITLKALASIIGRILSIKCALICARRASIC